MSKWMQNYIKERIVYYERYLQKYPHSQIRSEVEDSIRILHRLEK